MFSVNDVCRAMGVKLHAYTNLKRRDGFSFENDTVQGRTEELADHQALEACLMIQLCALGLSIKEARETIASQSLQAGVSPAVIFVRRGVVDIQIPVRQIMGRLLAEVAARGGVPFLTPDEVRSIMAK